MTIQRIDPYEWEEITSWIDRHNEKNVCTVVSLSVATGNPINECGIYMYQYGRRHRKGMYSSDWTKALKEMKTFHTVEGPYDRENKITVKKFIEKHPKGTYYCAVRGHAFVIKDSVVYDHSRSSTGRCFIYKAIKIVKKDD